MSPALAAVTESKTLAGDLANSAARKQAIDVLDQRRNASITAGMATGAVGAERDSRLAREAATTAVDPRNPLGIRRDSGTPSAVTTSSEQTRQDALDAAYRMGRAQAQPQVIVVDRGRSDGGLYRQNGVALPIAMGSRVDDDAAQSASDRLKKSDSGGALPWMGLFLTLLALSAIGGGLYCWWSRKQAAAIARSKRYAL